MTIKHLERTQSDRTILEVSDLRVNFSTREGVVRATSGVSFDLHKGETLGLVGESGCGKSVTAQAILRIIPSPGKIVKGKIIWHRSPEKGMSKNIDIAALNVESEDLTLIRRHEISLVMQEPMSALSPVHTVGNQIIEKILLDSTLTKHEARLQAIDLLNRVGIPNAEQRIDSYTFELSGGMRQRAMIAMALANNPTLLIADEPTTAVDVTIQAQILRLIRKLQDELGMAILMITHDLGVIANVAHRVAVMYRGKDVEQGPVLEIFQRPMHPYTQGLLDSIPDLSDKPGERISTIPGVVPHPYAVVTGCQFHPRCNQIIKGVCDQSEPGETEVTPEHKVRCFLYEVKE